MQGGRNEIPFGRGTPRFATFSEFLKYAGHEDRQCLLDEQGWERRFTETACAMANVAGGWIILGAEEAIEGPLPSQGEPFFLPGLDDPERVQASVAGLLSEACSTPLRAWTQFLSTERLLLVRVEPAVWHDRPVCVRRGHALDYARGSYRRVEGVAVASGLRARFLLGMDSLERLRDDRPVPGLKAQDLDAESLAAFREKVISFRPEWTGLAQGMFLSRALVLSGSEGLVTEAGRLLLGRETVTVHVSLHGGGALDVPNLWRACALLPRLTRSLSPACGTAFRECFLNALLHADYSAGGVTVELSETPGGALEARIVNFGLVREAGEGVPLCRNFRLMRIFQLMGLARGEGIGLKLIRRYSPLFHLEQDSLELRTAAVLPLMPAENIEDAPKHTPTEMPLLVTAPIFRPDAGEVPPVPPEPEPEATTPPGAECATPLTEGGFEVIPEPEPEPAPAPEVISESEPETTTPPGAERATPLTEEGFGVIPEPEPEPAPAPEAISESEPEATTPPGAECATPLTEGGFGVILEPDPAAETDVIPEPELEKTPEPGPVPEPEVFPEPEPVMSQELQEASEPAPASEPEVPLKPEPVMPSEPQLEKTPEPELTPEQLLFGEDHVVSLEEKILMEQIKALSENEQIQRISEMMDERAGDGVGREQKEGIVPPSRGLFGSAEDDLRQAIAEMREAEEERARTAGRNGNR